MATRIYRFTYNLPESFERAKVAIHSLEDYYPLDVSMCAMGSNGIRYLSNKITVHRFDPRALRAALFYSIQNPMEIWALDAAANGDNSGVQTTEVVLDVVDRRRPTKTCPACKQSVTRNFSRHLASCSRGKACLLCHEIPANLEEHQTNCSGNQLPCRVCGVVVASLQDQTEHELQCRRVNNNAHFERNVRPRVDVNNAEEIPDGEQALGGLCRKIVLNPPPNCGSDF